MALKRVTRNPIFWLMLLGKMSLMCVGQFISFMPLYLQTGFAMPSPQAAAASSLFALGSLTSSLLLIPSYQKMTSSLQVKTIAGLVRRSTTYAHRSCIYAAPPLIFDPFARPIPSSICLTSIFLIPLHPMTYSSCDQNLFNFALPGLLWAHHAALVALPNPTTVVPAILFLWGASWMLPFYVPPVSVHPYPYHHHHTYSWTPT